MSFIKDYAAYSRHSGSSVKPLFKVMLYCNLFFRLSAVFYKIKLFPVGRIFWLLNRILFSIDIDPRASLKGGMVILHGAGIVIGRYVRASGDFKIYQGATLGGNNGKQRVEGGQRFSQPVLGSGITIGIHAAVLGPVILGDGCSVGANAVVTKNVPPGVVVVSNNVILANRGKEELTNQQ